MQSMNFNPKAHPFVPSKSYRPSDTSTKRAGNRPSGLENIPDVLLVTILSYLDTLSLIRVSAVSQRMRGIAVGFSVQDRIQRNLAEASYRSKLGSHPALYITARPDYERLTKPMQLLRLELVAKTKNESRFSIAEEAKWHHKAMPVVKADTNKMVLATGNDLWISFRSSDWAHMNLGAPGIGDVTDIALTTSDDEILVSFVDGRIEKLKLHLSGSMQRHSVSKRYCTKADDAVESIDYLQSYDALLSVHRSGVIKINQDTLSLRARPWCTTFLNHSRMIATGLRSKAPLAIHEFTPYGIKDTRQYATHNNLKSSVLGVTSLTSNLVLSGWYDGTTRLHDIRLPNSEAVSSWREPYNDAAVYSVAASGCSIYSGSAVNGSVSFFDLRSTKGDRSVFLGGKHERGPVYSLVAEHERIFGAMETSVRGIDFYRTSCQQTVRADWIGSSSGGYFVDHATKKLLYSLNLRSHNSDQIPAYPI